jgi:flagellar basal body rod protein FlgG
MLKIFSQKNPKRKKYDLRSRASISKVDTHVQAKETNTSTKLGSSKATGDKIDQQ